MAFELIEELRAQMAKLRGEDAALSVTDKQTLRTLIEEELRECSLETDAYAAACREVRSRLVAVDLTTTDDADITSAALENLQANQPSKQAATATPPISRTA